MTDHRISPSTTRKITTAMMNTTVYRSRIWRPSLVTAIGGYRLPTNCSPASNMLTPRASRIRVRPMIAAPMARAKIAVCEERDLGELDIKALEDGRVPGRGATTDAYSRRGRPLGGRAAAILPGASMSRALLRAPQHSATLLHSGPGCHR